MQTGAVSDTSRASNRDVDFTATCVGASEIPITLHLGQDLAVTSWLFRRSKYWLAREPARISFAELETVLAGRAHSFDERKASIAALQDAIIELGWTLNESADEIVLEAVRELTEGGILDTAAIIEITANAEDAS